MLLSQLRRRAKGGRNARASSRWDPQDHAGREVLREPAADLVAQVPGDEGTCASTYSGTDTTSSRKISVRVGRGSTSARSPATRGGPARLHDVEDVDRRARQRP